MALFVAAAILLACLPVSGARADEEEPAGDPTWNSYATGLEVRGISSIRIHPKTPETMYAHVHGLGIARSGDGGATWTAIHEGIDPRHLPGPHDPCEISLDPRDEQVLWVATGGRVYRSDDQGATWEEKSSGALASPSWDRLRTEMAIRGVVVDPTKSLHILAGTRTGGALQGGLFESTDGGKTWEQIAGSNMPRSELGHDAWPILMDPSTDKNVLVGGSAGLWLSTDRGREFARADPGEVGAHDVRALVRSAGRGRDVYLCDGRGLWASRRGHRSALAEAPLRRDARPRPPRQR
ncbi:MAG: WD40/YVTN/BNR-like repeat-containing protein [Planctomycetota bacterium]